MRRLRKGLTWLSVIIFFLGIGVCCSEETFAAERGSPDNPILTNNRSVEKYFFDTYKTKSDVKRAYDAYQSYAGKNDDAPWYVRLGDTSKLTKEQIVLNAGDSAKKSTSKNETPLYVCWISYLKRAPSGRTGSYEECADNSAGSIKVNNAGEGNAIYYNTFGYGLKKTRTDYTVAKPGLLGDSIKSFVWYDGVEKTTDHKKVTATKTNSGKIASFWMYTKGGEYGYVVYYVKYSELYDFIKSYNENATSDEQFETTQVDGQKYTQYDVFLNGSVAVHNGGNGWKDNSTTFEKNSDYLKGTFGPSYLDKYAEQNYNRHIKLHVLNGIPVVVRAWDISTNKLVSEKTGSSTDYYLQAFDSNLSSVNDSDGVYWDLSSSTHTTDIQQAMIKFLYKETDDGGTRASVAYGINGYDYKSRDIDSFIRRRNMGLISAADGDDGYAVLYLPKRDGMTSVSGVETADAYAPIGFRVFAYDGAKRDDLVAKNYAQLRSYDPNTGKAAETGGFAYTTKTTNYCYDVPETKVGKKKLRVLNFDIRKDVRTSEGLIKHTTRMEWPKTKDALYDKSKGNHTTETVVACKFFTGHALTTKITKLKNKELQRTSDGTRYVYTNRREVGGNESSTLPNGKPALVSIKQVAEGLGAKTSAFELKNSTNLGVDNPSCIVIDILVSEMYYDQSNYNVEQLAVLDNNYDTEQGIWGYVGSGKSAVKDKNASKEDNGVTKGSLPSVVHAEKDDSASSNTVSVLDAFQKQTSDYLRFDLSEYGKKEASFALYSTEWRNYLDKNAYEVRQVSAKSYKAIKATSEEAAKTKAADTQLASKGANKYVDNFNGL